MSGGTVSYMRKGAFGLDYEIRRVCSYISDDQYIASYFGVKVDRVRAERGKLPKGAPTYANDQNGKGGNPLPGNETAWRTAAEQSNREFLAALDRFYANREAKMRRAG